jgi:hypothetical protein
VLLRSSILNSLFSYEKFSGNPKKATDYADYYTWFTFNVWKNWTSVGNANVTRRTEFNDAVESWAHFLGMERYYSYSDDFYAKIKDSNHLDEMLC